MREQEGERRRSTRAYPRQEKSPSAKRKSFKPGLHWKTRRKIFEHSPIAERLDGRVLRASKKKKKKNIGDAVSSSGEGSSINTVETSRRVSEGYVAGKVDEADIGKVAATSRRDRVES